MNIIQIAGHLGADAETRVTPDGQKVTTLRVATNQRRGGREETIWWRVTLWGDRWDRMLPYFTKGSAIIVVGELQKPEIFTNRDGQSQVSLDIRADIVRFSPFGKGERTGAEGQPQTQAAPMSHPSYGTAPTSPGAQTPYGRTMPDAPIGAPTHSMGHIPDEDIPF